MRMEVRLQTYLDFVSQNPALNDVMLKDNSNVLTGDRIPTLLLFGLSKHSAANMESEVLT
jgi:hypothetical protein